MNLNPKLLLLTFAISMCGTGIVTAQNLVPNCPQADGTIHTITVSGDTVFIGGEFSRVYAEHYQSNYGTVLSTPPNVILPQWVKPNGTVFSAVPDGHNGYYIGGSFNMVGDQARPGLAHIDSTGKVTSRFNDIAADNTVRTLAIKDDTLYAGGEFTRVGTFAQSYGGLVGYDEKLKGISKIINGIVYCAISDGSGGWYIGGNFTKVGPYERNRIAHIDKSGLISSWNPNADGDVYTLLLYNEKLYAGGGFLNIGTQNQEFLAEINVSTGIASSWDPNVNNAVYALTASGSTLFVGGSFSQVGGLTRNNLAAVDLTTAVVNSWNPGANNVVNALAISDTLVYAGGYFNTIGGQSRNYLAALGATGGQATGWNPNPSNAINTIALSGSNLYIGGKFMQVGFKNRKFIACIERSSGIATSWDPDPDNVVNCITISGNSIYVGGDFSKISGTVQEYIAELDISTASIISWDPNPDGPVNCICPTLNGIFVGGDFKIIGGKTRNYLACFILDKVEDNLIISSWNPNANAPVHTLAVDTLIVYAGGEFTTVGNYVRTYLAALEKKVGNAYVWNPKINGVVRALALKDYTLYAGGDFDSVESFGCHHIAAIDKNFGIPNYWIPQLDGSVKALAVTDSFVYAGGDFRMAGDSVREHLVAIRRNSQATITSWNPDVDSMGTVNVLSILNDTIIYAGGTFATISDKQRNCFTAMNRHTAETYYTPNTNSTVYTLGLSGTNLFVGGDYTIIGEVYRNSIAAFRAGTGEILDWKPFVRTYSYPYIEAKVYTIAVNGPDVFIGGVFDSVGTEGRSNITGLDRQTGMPTAWAPQADNTVKAIVIADSMVYVGGDFSYISGKDKYKAAALSRYTANAYDWDLYTNGIVHTIAVRDSIVYLGGDFSFIGNAFRNKLAAVSRKTGVATSWDPNIGGLSVYSIVYKDSLIYAGGSFDYIGANGHKNLAAISLTTGKAKSWAYDADGVVNELLIKNNELYVGGDFTTIKNKSRNKLAAIDLLSDYLKEWKPNATGSVYSIMNYGEGRIFFGGGFGTVLTKPVYRLAEVDTGSITCNLTAVITHSVPAQICEGDSFRLNANPVDGYFYKWFRNDTLITGAADSSLYVALSGNYNVIVKDSFGCVDTSSHAYVTVRAKPSTNVIAGDDHVFCGYIYSYKITEHSGSTYSWTVDEGTIISGLGTDSIAIHWGGDPGSGSIKMVETNANGCVGDTQRLNVVMDTVYLFAQPSQLNYLVTSETKQVTVTSNLDWNVSTDEPSWVTLSKSSGTGNDAVDITVSSNSAHTARTATVTFSANGLSRFVYIHQDSVPDIEELSLNKDSIKTGISASTIMVKLHSNTSWNVTNNASWVTVNPMSGIGDTTLEINITANATPVARNTDIQVATSKLTASLHIEQAGNVGLNNLDMENAILLYPNPSNGMVTLQNQAQQEVTVFVYDVNGKQKDHFTCLAGERKDLDYTSFNSGIYLAQISAGESKKYLKFIITK